MYRDPYFSKKSYYLHIFIKIVTLMSTCIGDFYNIKLSVANKKIKVILFYFHYKNFQVPITGFNILILKELEMIKIYQKNIHDNKRLSLFFFFFFFFFFIN